MANKSRIGNLKHLIGARERMIAMALNLTLKEAQKNADEWQKAYLKAKRNFLRSKKPKYFFEMKECEQALEWYNGYVEHEPMRDENGRVVLDKDGKIIRTDAIKEEVQGAIPYLAGMAQRLRDESNLGERFLNRTFENFDVERNKKAYASAKAYADRENLFSDRENCRMFVGDVGTGKTHLAAAIANQLINRGIPVLFSTCSEHMAKIKSQFDTDYNGQYIMQMKNIPMLVIDDLGKERRTEWTESVLFDVFNHRYEHMLPTVITTNLTDQEFTEHVGRAAASRFLEIGKVIRTTGVDYRSL